MFAMKSPMSGTTTTTTVEQPPTTTTTTNGSASTSSSTITTQHLRKLLKNFAANAYKPSKDPETKIEDQCIQLFARDYPSHVIITNHNGELSNSYPVKIIVPETEDFLPHNLDNNQTSLTDSTILHRANTFSADFRRTRSRIDAAKIKELMTKARVARCRTRFPVPVIVYRNRYICRSATLSGAAELVGRSVYDYCTQGEQTSLTNASHNIRTEYVKTEGGDDEDFVEAIVESPPNHSKHHLKQSHNHHQSNHLHHRSKSVDSGNVFTQARNKDIALLRYFGVHSICDLMLEKKKVKFGVIVTSSEKADKESRYANFDIFALPYPGCEFFREYRDANYVGEGLVYNWNQTFVDAKLELPNSEDLRRSMNIEFNDYRDWDVILLTQNYMKLLVKILREQDSSLLVHCISGWDRTPLFISLLRLTLWADGEIHKSLNALEITYLTLAYDWYLFGHQLTDRLAKGEEIMFFCFQFLKHIADDEFSINYLPPLGECPGQRGRNASIDSYDKNDFVLPEDILAENNSTPAVTSVTSSCQPLPPIFFSCDPIANDDLFDGSFSSIDHDLGALSVSPEPPLSSSVYVVDSSSEDAMTSTLTEEATEVYFPEVVNRNPKSESRPMEIPSSTRQFSRQLNNGSQHYSNSSTPSSRLSLNRNDSWQVVSDAGSIRDNFLMNQFSSPDSCNSLRRDHSLTDSPVFARHHFSTSATSTTSTTSSTRPARITPTKLGERRRKLSEVRSIFNCAYTSLNFSHNNGRFTNIVGNFVTGTFYNNSSKDSI